MASKKYLGDGVYVNYVNNKFLMEDRNGCVCEASTSAMLQLEQYIKSLKAEKNTLGLVDEEADVWHEGTKSFYRAMLIRKLSIDEVYERMTK